MMKESIDVEVIVGWTAVVDGGTSSADGRPGKNLAGAKRFGG